MGDPEVRQGMIPGVYIKNGATFAKPLAVGLCAASSRDGAGREGVFPWREMEIFLTAHKNRRKYKGLRVRSGGEIFAGAEKVLSLSGVSFTWKKVHIFLPRWRRSEMHTGRGEGGGDALGGERSAFGPAEC